MVATLFWLIVHSYATLPMASLHVRDLMFVRAYQWAIAWQPLFRCHSNSNEARQCHQGQSPIIMSTPLRPIMHHHFPMMRSESKNKSARAAVTHARLTIRPLRSEVWPRCLFILHETCSDSIPHLFCACFYGVVRHNYGAMMGCHADMPV